MMNCPSCKVGITFLGTWDNAMQYYCKECSHDISMTKNKVEHKHVFICEGCGQRTNCDVCGKKMNRWKSHGTLRHSDCGYETT